MNILVSGSLAYDRIMDFPGKFSDHILPDKIHILNVSFNVNGLTEKFGGTAGNIAFTLGLLGEKPIIVASAGTDFDRYDAWLQKNGLTCEGIRIISEEFTAGAYITTDLSDNQITGFNMGAMKHPSLFSFDVMDGKSTLAIISPGCIEDMVTYSREFKRLEIPYIFDPGQSIPALTAAQMTEMITGAAMLISNDYELELIRKATGLDMEDFLSRTPVVITTLGEKGSVLRTRDSETEIPAVTAEKVLDPTGAGDAYRAGLIKGMVTGKTLADSARMGSVCAAFAVTRQGTQEHRFTLEEFQARYQTAFGGNS